MPWPADQLAGSPAVLRALPFGVFLVLTALQGQFDTEPRFWIYLAKTVAGLWLLWAVRPWVAELKWKWSWEAALVGVAVFVIWVGLDGLYPPLGKAAPWNPHAQFGEGSALAWLFVLTRLGGVSLVVPPLEEVFYRSFIYRYVAHRNFLSVPLGRFLLVPFCVTTLLFGFEHREWLAGILAGVAYQALVIWKNRLGDAITAHALTNLLLGLWVLARGAWHFW